MAEYIRVLGPDPDNKGSNIYFFLHSSLVTKILPVWAEVKDGKAWLCAPDHPNAQVVSCTLVDHAGNRYSCGKVEELRKLLDADDLCVLFGKKPSVKDPIGFIHGKGKSSEQADLAEPHAGARNDECGVPAPERPHAGRGSKEAVLKHFGVFQDDADLGEQLADIGARRKAARE